MDSDDVYLELRRQLDFSKKVVERSEIYSKLTDQLTNNTAVKCSIARVLGSRNQLPMVIYELGSIQYSWPSRICLSLALLLKENSGGLIEGIEVFEPTATPVESRVIEDLGCSISLINEMCQRVDKPTLFFLQYPDRVLFEHLFEINWCPDRLSQMIVLGYSFKRMMERINTYISDQEEEGVTEQRNKLQRLIAIQKYVYEFNVCDKIKSMHRGELLIEEEWEQQCDDPPMCASEASGNNNAEMDFDREDNDGEEGRSNSEFDEYDEGIFYVMLSLHFFKLDPDTNMEALLPSTSSKGIIKLDQMKISHENPLSWYFSPDGGAYMEEEDVEEALKLKEEIETTMEEIKESELYINLRNQLVNDPEVRDNVIRVLGSHESIQMVIYGIGSTECSFDSQYQLALALLLREDSCLPIGDIEIYDPVLSQADIKAYSDLRCKVLLINEQCRRRVEKPTLFFIPGLMVWLVGNLLEVTFDPKQLNQMILIDTIGRGRLETLDQLVTEGPSGLAIKVLEHEERERFRWVIRNYVNKEISFDYYDKCYHLSELKISFFNVGPNVDMKSSLPSVSMKQRFKSDYFVAKEHRNTLIFDRLAYYHMYAEVRYMEPFTEDFYDPYLDRSCLPSSPDEKWSYIYGHIRGPARYRRTGFEPQKGWVKLNFSGISHGKEVPAGFGGVVHDEHDNLVVSYAGPLRDVDFTMASVEALRRGLRCLIDLNFSPLPKLIIEGDALSIIRWANRSFPPPERATKAFEEIYDLISDVECVISYVHEEANHKAVELAKKGAKLHKFQIWEHQRKVI